MTAVSGQKVCPKCYKMNPAELEICNGCGSSLENAHVAPSGGRRSIFGYIPTEKQEVQALDPATPKKVFESTRAKNNMSTNKSEEFYLFKEKTEPARPWA